MLPAAGATAQAHSWKRGNDGIADERRDIHKVGLCLKNQLVGSEGLACVAATCRCIGKRS